VSGATVITEQEALRQLGLLYNHKQDNSPQFTRWQMIAAMSHGYRMALGTTASDATKPVVSRPAEPELLADLQKGVWYRGWECSYDNMAGYWTGEGYFAALGGADLDCIYVRASTWSDLLDEIDDHDKTEAGA
jgi:hypothetical protein